jgi:hypothetical protein
MEGIKAALNFKEVKVPDTNYEVESSSNGGLVLIRVNHDGFRTVIGDKLTLRQAKKLMMIDSDVMFRDTVT